MPRSADTIYSADLFCGAGGTSLGLGRACEDLGLQADLVAINHWKRAVETHRHNHPWARHLCARVDALTPREVVPGGRLDLVVAGVECTHHSQARGGRPLSDQSRASAWDVIRWTEHLRVRDILVENVPEFRSWGPLDDSGRPIKARKGEIFEAFVGALEAFGYRVEHEVLTCCDYGDPTSRRRLFLRARIDNGDIRWPDPTHAPRANGLPPYRTARQIIDWKDLGTSIFARKRPLAPRTIERIASGISRFCGELAEPFLVMLYGTGTVRSIDRPLPTVTAGGNHVGLAQPFLVQFYGQSDVSSTDNPMPTLCTQNKQALATPFLLPLDGPFRPREDQASRTLDRPLQTVRATRGGGGHLVTPFLLAHDQWTAKNGQNVDSLDRPMRTVTAHNGDNSYLVSPFLVPHFGERPGQEPRTHDVGDPLPTVTATKGGPSLVSPFIVRYNRTGKPQDVGEPLGTVTTRDRFALVTPEAQLELDIYFRMLKPRELARAQGFPDDFDFVGNKGEVVRQIGNAVPVGTAEALCRAALETTNQVHS